MAGKNEVKDKTATAAPVKLFTRAEVAKQAKSLETWIIIHNKVYNVTSFLNEHPGGEEVLLEQSGCDATEAFEDIGHSSDARELMEPLKIGEIVEEERTKDTEKKTIDWSNDNSDENNSRSEGAFDRSYEVGSDVKRSNRQSSFGERWFLAFLVNPHCARDARYPCLSLLHQYALKRIPTEVQQVSFSALLVNIYTKH